MEKLDGDGSRSLAKKLVAHHGGIACSSERDFPREAAVKDK